MRRSQIARRGRHGAPRPDGVVTPVYSFHSPIPVAVRARDARRRPLRLPDGRLAGLAACRLGQRVPLPDRLVPRLSTDLAVARLTSAPAGRVSRSRPS